MKTKKERKLWWVRRRNHMRIEIYDPQFNMALDHILGIRFPEAKILFNESRNIFSVKKTFLDQVSISIVDDPEQNTTFLTFEYIPPITGCMFIIFGIWPALLQLVLSKNFKRELIEEIGRDLGAKYRVKVEYVRKTLHPILYFLWGGVLIASMMFGYAIFLEGGVSSHYHLSPNGYIELSAYTLMFWIAFFIFIRFPDKLIPVTSYIFLIFASIIGLTIIENVLAYEECGEATLLGQIGGRFCALLIMVVTVYILWKINIHKKIKHKLIIYTP